MIPFSFWELQVEGLYPSIGYRFLADALLGADHWHRWGDVTVRVRNRITGEIAYEVLRCP